MRLSIRSGAGIGMLLVSGVLSVSLTAQSEASADERRKAIQPPYRRGKRGRSCCGLGHVEREGGVGLITVAAREVGGARMMEWDEDG